MSGLVIGSAANGQSFNVDVGSIFSQPPPPSYGAAGAAGTWNSVTAEHVTPFTTGPHPQDVMLVDILGTPTNVGFHQFGGMDLTSDNDPAVSGNDALLMEDYLVTHSTTLESCMYLNGLQDGTYEMLVYAWMPNQPSIEQKVRFDFHPGFEIVGGAWPGQHEEGTTYSRHTIEVTGGFIGFHVGIPTGGNTTIGAAFNGFQLRPVPEGPVPAASTWGMAVMALFIVTAATLVFRSRIGAPAAG